MTWTWEERVYDDGQTKVRHLRLMDPDPAAPKKQYVWSMNATEGAGPMFDLIPSMCDALNAAQLS